MKTTHLFLLLLVLTSCKSLVKNTAGKVNANANEQVFALKGYQPIDPISVNIEAFKIDSIIYLFPNEATRVAIGKLNQSGSLSFTTSTYTRRGESYTIIIDYIKYKTTSIPARYSLDSQVKDSIIKTQEILSTKFGKIGGESTSKFSPLQNSTVYNMNSQDIKIPVYVGVGLRIQSNITVLKDSLNINLGSLYNLGIAAAQNQISGTLVIQTLGVSGPQISSAIPIPDKINESTIQNAITSLATIKSKLYDKETKVYPHVVGFGLSYSIEGAKDLIEASLHSKPPKIKGITKDFIDFEEYDLDNINN